MSRKARVRRGRRVGGWGEGIVGIVGMRLRREGR